MRAIPMESLRFMPPESALVREWRLSSRLRILRMWLISSGHLDGGYPFSCQREQREGKAHCRDVSGNDPSHHISKWLLNPTTLPPPQPGREVAKHTDGLLPNPEGTGTAGMGVSTEPRCPKPSTLPSAKQGVPACR